ncbi:major facilitator superfamily domain-containing protein [Clohesyomyces aquaticus]|uniref:Major facilitator superfamily domain-containing protein n=1 Tax=Clohesyomyces aquaticus TaxID=1231657 RepID=A0A1Y2A4S7_9PLEO|nr:major facilitator superfamily domain-containing protein [Clohesyomyces aquaticus]
MSANNSPRGSFEEEAPLLSPTASEASIPPGFEAPQKKKKKPWIVLCALVFFLVAIIDIGSFLAEPPKTRVYEANLCLRYYQEHDASKIEASGDVPESLCKVNEVQEKMAMIFGWQELWDSIPSMLLAVPYGTLADKYGRKWIFCLGLVGLQLNSIWVLVICYFRSLPLQLTWLSSAFLIIGGGPIVVTAIGITMVSDIVPPEKRTSIFLYLFASVLVAELLAPLIAAELMKKGDWLPLLLALGIQQVGMMIALFFPETLHLRDMPEPTDHDTPEAAPKADIGHGFKAQISHFKDAFRFLRRDAKLTLIIFTFLASRLARQALVLLLRYASKRYNWTIQKAAYLLSFRAATNLVALTVFIPLVNLVLLKLARLSAHQADLWIARGSIILTTLSMLIMAAAGTPPLLILGLLVYNLGTGYGAAMRSISIHTVGGQASPDIGRMFAVIAVMESIGAFIAGPLLSTAFQWGMSIGEPWIGMPFLVAGIIFVFVTMATFMISEKDQIVVPTQYTEVDSATSVSASMSLEEARRPSV